MALLEGREVSKHFGGIAALRRVSFDVHEGEILGLIGANGAGKTTLFNIIAGTYRPDEGEVRFRGEVISGFSPHQICRRTVVKTFQVAKPFLAMSVLENVVVGALFGSHRHRSVRAARRAATDIIQFVGLREKRHTPASDLTIVDRKRLEVARSLATEPTLLLLDEVLAGLTPTETADAMRLVEAIRRERGITIFMIEHVMKALVGLSDRVIVLHYGEKIAEGPPQEVARNDEVIAAYLGERIAL